MKRIHLILCCLFMIAAAATTFAQGSGETLISNATILTASHGKIENGSILIRGGKIVAVGKAAEVKAGPGAKEIDATGMFVTPGFVDSHSHTALDSVNEGSLSVTAMVRMRDVVDDTDINIYRQLAGGMTTIHPLHGSANSIGGQSFSYPLDRATFDSPVVTGTGGCPHSGGPVPSLESRHSKIGGTWYLDLTQAPAGQPVIQFLNVGLPLSTPFPLDVVFPGVQPSCQINLSGQSLFSVASMTTAQGTKTFTLAIPYTLAWNDLVLSSQAFCFDFFAPGGLVTSNGDQMQLGVDPAMSLLNAKLRGKFSWS